MPVGDYNIMWTVDHDITATTLQDMMNRAGVHQSNVSTNTNTQQETLEWAKFAMWLRGFLGALEGKQLAPEDIDKIMEKLAVVDPESQNWRYEQPAYPYYNPPVQPAVPRPTTTVPTWVYNPSTTVSDGTSPTSDTVNWTNDAK